MQNVGNAIEKYSAALEYSKYIPVIGKYLKLLPKLSEKIGKSLKNNAELKLNNVFYRKDEVERALRELENRILVVIDDIDRLSNEQIRLIFQLITALAGFPNVIYLLSFDRDIVSRALSDIQHCNGEEYLEKVIQVPFDIPPIDNSRLNNILFERLDELVEIHDGMEFDSQRWNSVFNSCISPYINTLRDINRFCNVFSFMYSDIKHEVDFIDMAGICSLRVFANPIFEWIRNHKFSLVGGYNGRGKSVNEAKQRKAELLDLFSNIYPTNPQGMLQAVASLFPKFYDEFSFTGIRTEEEIHQAMRIASKSKFDLYFSLSLEDVKISRDEIDRSLHCMDETELRKYIYMLKEQKLFDEYLKEVKCNLSRISEYRVELILSALLFDKGRIADKTQKLSGINSEEMNAYMIAEILLKISDECVRFELLVNMFKNTDFLSFQELLHLLHIIELSHGKIAVTDHINDEKLISLEHLNEIERIFIQRIEDFSVDNNMLDLKEYRIIVMLWKFIDLDGYSKYINKALSNELNAIKYLSLYMTIWRTSGSRRIYELKDKSFNEYISSERLLEIIESNRKRKDFWVLSEEKIEVAAAFFLMMNSDNLKKEIEINDIKAKISEWRKEL